ncbi:hypothetical protein B9Z19DRAFT_1092142 [Tuber borchii]|uniref:Uncharacterized protein n=1 Tax=Tuber borchii TaxID=42251 RepID=A0A2T6ZGT4_TUBBO|nr:hypothetical protein B9Z19DRAFT_1092142 [Tuber borchii]
MAGHLRVEIIQLSCRARAVLEAPSSSTTRKKELYYYSCSRKAPIPFLPVLPLGTLLNPLFLYYLAKQISIKVYNAPRGVSENSYQSGPCCSSPINKHCSWGTRKRMRTLRTWLYSSTGTVLVACFPISHLIPKKSLTLPMFAFPLFQSSPLFSPSYSRNTHSSLLSFYFLIAGQHHL